MSRAAADLRAFVAAARKALRETRRYPGLYLGVIFWPVAMPAGWVLTGRALSGDDPQALAAFVGRGGVESVAGFVFIGHAMYLWLSVILWGPGTALREEQIRGSLEATFLTPASRLVLLFGPSASQILPVSISFGVSGLALWLLFGVVPPLGQLLPAALVLVAGVPAMYGLGALFGAFVLRFGEVNALVQLIRGVLVLACGVTFPLSMLPDWAHVGALLLAPTHIVEGTRQALFAGASLERLGASIVVSVALGAITCALAVAVFGWSERAARRSGMLARY